MRKRRAASRVETPSSIAAITRPRRSPLRLLVIITSWQITSSSESDKADRVNPQTDSAFIEDALDLDQKTDLCYSTQSLEQKSRLLSKSFHMVNFMRKSGNLAFRLIFSP